MPSNLPTRLIASLILVCATFVIQAAPTALATPITVPTGLNPGDHYRLAFVTSTTSVATSTSIADYNSFVTNVANNQSALHALGTTWSAIGSTFLVDARDNTGTNNLTDPVGVPIYTLANSKIADRNDALWSSSGSGLLTALNIDETGSLRSNTLVWTGSTFTGTGSAEAQLGTANAREGLDANSNSAWIQYLNDTSSTQSKSLYAMSGILTVPEPSTMVLACFAVGGLAVTLLRRRRNCRL